MEQTTTIYYFTGSGNSMAVARQLARRLDGELVPIVHTLSRTPPRIAVDAIGLVFPTYDFRAPRLVTDWINGLNGLQGKYVFAVSTYGISAGRSLPRLRDVIVARGATLAGGFALAMPHNGIGCGLIRDKRRVQLVAAASERIEEISHYIHNRRTGYIESRLAATSFFRPEILKMVPKTVRLIFKLITGGAEALAFQADDSCTQCGTCSRICPVSNIEMVDGRPQWLDRCVNCFACLHWCPVNAISLGGLDMGIAQYHHPDIALEDVAAQKG